MKKLLFSILLIASFAAAQQAQTTTAPIYPVNARYVQGTSPGYWATPGSGLTLNIAAGRARCASTMVNYAGGTLTMADNTTNYVYLDTTSSCVPDTNTAGYTNSLIAIATVVTSGGDITSIADDRTLGMGQTNPGGGGGGSGTVNSGTAGQVAWYPSTGASVSGNSRLTEDSTTGLSYSGAGGFNLTASGSTLQTFTDQTTTPSGTVPSGKSFVYTKGGVACTKDDAGTEHCAGSGSTAVRAIPFTIGDPAGSALTSGATTTDYVTVPFGCTISAYNLVLAPSGTVTVKFWKIATGTAIPTSSNSISTSGVGISTGTAIHSTTVSDFTSTTVTANDIMAMNVTAVSTASYVQGVVECDQ